MSKLCTDWRMQGLSEHLLDKPSKYSPLTWIHFSRWEIHSKKTFLNCSLGIQFIHWYSALPTALRVSNLCPHRQDLIYGLSQESQGERLGL